MHSTLTHLDDTFSSLRRVALLLEVTLLRTVLLCIACIQELASLSAQTDALALRQPDNQPASH